MATRKKRVWPFDDKKQVAQMARALGAPTQDDWGADDDWAAKLAAAAPARWSADPDWGVDPAWAAKLRVRLPGSPLPDRSQATVTLGYHPDLPDFRDYTVERVVKGDEKGKGKEKEEAKKKAREKEALVRENLPLLLSNAALPTQVNNIPWCSPIEDQGNLGSCTAQAVVGLMEYMQRRSGKSHTEGSRLFLYKVSRTLLGWTGDTGAYLRTAIKAVAAFGVPPEQYWPYVIDKYEDEPSAFLYAYAQNYQALDYARLDAPGVTPANTLTAIKRALASKLCVVFGFPVYSSLDASGEIPFPSSGDKLLGGHAVMAVGYDDKHGKNGALLIRNSWGPQWGYQGYGYLPYEYVTQSLAVDFWTVMKSEWLKLEQFD